MPDPLFNGYYTRLCRELGTRAARAVIGKLAPVSKSLRDHLRERLERDAGETGSFLSDPVFEAAFGWKQANPTMAELSGTLLDSSLVDAMDEPSEDLRFGSDRHPYEHQLAAWSLLRESPPRSLVISSGTSSGKTECFLVPVLDSLARQAEGPGIITGVQAILLYPLNALINSQQERLRAWTKKFGGRVRFCLYNGETPDEVPAARRAASPEQVLDRLRLRENPPPVLVTNSTMLEYMLVRPEDRRLLDLSAGKLRWIILDEAHTYVGSQAAELSLLLRRVIHAFDVDVGSVRFIATSATIGNDPSDATTNTLKTYLADVAGIAADRVTVVRGAREVPDIPPEWREKDIPLPDVDVFAGLSPEERYEVMASCRPMRRMRRLLTEEGPQKLSVLASILMGTDIRHLAGEDRKATLRYLDIATSAIRNGTAFLPLRGHLFHRTQSGLWACSNPVCPGKKGTALEGGDWSFGRIYLERRAVCGENGCGALVFPLLICDTCGAEYLSADETLRDERRFLVPREETPDDDDLEEEERLLDEVGPVEEEGGEATRIVGFSRLLPGSSALEDVHRVSFDPVSGELEPRDGTAVSIRILLPAPEDDSVRCTRCREREQIQGRVFRPARIGGSFFLRVAIPALLEFAPPVGKGLPNDGRRMITFTDSRKGSAVFALQTQIDAERNYVRGWLYHQVWAKQQHVDEEAIREQRARVADLERVVGPGSSLSAILTEQKRKLQTMENPPAPELSWGEAIAKLASTDGLRLMRQFWRQEVGDEAEEKLANFCLLREFARRPMRHNSLETLGLLALRYPALDRVQDGDAPAAWRRLGLPSAEWCNFLKVTLDYFVRARSAIRVSRVPGPEGGAQEFLRRWIGVPIRFGFLVAQGTEVGARRNIIAWPKAGSGGPVSRLVLLLHRATGLRLDEPEDRETINDLLREGWKQLLRLNLLEPEEGGYVLDLGGSAVLAAVREGWLCPVTRRILDTTLLGWTPYLTRHVPDDIARCTRTQMPPLPFPFGRDASGNDIPAGVLRSFLETDLSVSKLRSEGVWTDLSDRIFQGTSYFRIAEHSAQLSSVSLRGYEKEFKEGRINVLSCSTTMELGVDIGGMSVVCMNNAPPGPANFVQRAGRAGRRGENTSVSMTLCKSLPHGEAVFADPMWPFRTPLHLPRVTLESDRIVHRHVHSLALARYFRDEPIGLVRLGSGSFFEAADGAMAPVDRMLIWLRDIRARRKDSSFAEGIRKLTARTRLAGVGLSRLLEETASSLEAIARGWRREVGDMIDELDSVGGPPGDRPTPPQMAIWSHLERLRGEYLLGELATRTFLPGYGFPTDVVPFVNTTREMLDREFRSRARGLRASREREEGLGRRRSYPSRQLPLAIRDYAPGSDVVIDGQVYRSGGITLNWHLPPDVDSAGELQAFRTAWRCRRCGASGTLPVNPRECSACGAEATQLRTIYYLQPTGFAVDLNFKPHNDLSSIDYVPPRNPWIFAGSTLWQQLPHPEVGRYRVGSMGKIISRSAGSYGRGFAICLRCGKAESERNDIEETGDPPQGMSNHSRLRGGVRNGGARCRGNDEVWAIKRHQWLCSEATTDVFELQLNAPGTGFPVADDKVVLSISVALRQALAETLGVVDREIGCASIPSRSATDAPARSIVLYDTASGGAGYVAATPAMLPRLMRRASEILNCSRDCDVACQGCLLTYDTQHELGRLDRKSALRLLDERLLDLLELPMDARLFGPASVLESDLPEAALGRELQKPDMEEVRVYLGGGLEFWDPARWPLRNPLLRWSSEGRTIRLITARRTIDSLPDHPGNLLSSLAEAGGIEIRATEENVVDPGVPSLCAEVGGRTRYIRWAFTSEQSTAPGEEWGRATEDERCIRAVFDTPLPPITGVVIPPASVRRLPPKTFREKMIRAELDGPVNRFGERFWNLVSHEIPQLQFRLKDGSPIRKVLYRDRYVGSPLSALLISRLIRGLEKYSGTLAADTEIRLETCELRRQGGRIPESVHHDWTKQRDQEDVIKKLLPGTGNVQLTVLPHRNGAQHARELGLTFDDGAVWMVRLDHGVGFLGSGQEKGILFNFLRPPGEQVRELELFRFPVVNREKTGTRLYMTDIIRPAKA